MSESEHDALEHRYRRTFGYVAGYLPRQRHLADAWLAQLRAELSAARARGGGAPRSPAVAALAELLDRDGIVRMYVEKMIAEVPATTPPASRVSGIPELLAALDHIVTTAPLYTSGNTFPMSTLFTYMMMTPAGEAAFRDARWNAGLRRVLKEWCDFLDSPASRYVLTPQEWLSPEVVWKNKLYEFVIPDREAPHWGFASFNAYFHREIKLGFRPLAGAGDSKVIVSPNDGKVYDIARNVKALDTFWAKGQPYSLTNILDGEHVERFIGGDVFQSFLSGADYHRWRSPVAGVVRQARVVDGLMFSNAESAGPDPTAGTYSQGYQASVNTRGLVFIEADDPTIGWVCVIPIGITEISSVTITAKVGARVDKGDELGFFSYGGSTLAVVFQPGAIDHFTVPNRAPDSNPDDGPPIQVRGQIAVAR